MSEQKEHIQQAIEDLATIRRAIQKAESGETANPIVLAVTLQTHLLLQSLAFIFALLILVVEFFSNHGNTASILLSAHHENLRIFGLIQTAFLLCVLVFSLYFIVRRAARQSDRDFQHFLSRNFVYLRNLSFLSDLLVKYAVFAALILAKKPEWIAPMFFIFTGDYLLQGRFFRLPVSYGLMLALLSFFGGILQFQYDSPFLFWPVANIALISAISISCVLGERRRLNVAKSEALIS